MVDYRVYPARHEGRVGSPKAFMARDDAAAYVNAEGLGPAFIDYMRTWTGFVAA